MKRDSVVTILLGGIIVSLIYFSPQAKTGALGGLELCENVIIPSLLPMLIITSLINKSRCSLIFEKLLGGFTEKILKLPRASTSAILLGLIGGYPSGAILCEQMHRNGQISDSDASRIMKFNFCGGLAFIITAVGTIHYGSTKIGLALYLSNLISSIIVASVSALFCKEKVTASKANYDAHLSINDAMIEAVDSTTHSTLIMCSYIILFSAIMSIAPIPSWINPLIEITSGIVGKESSLSLPYSAFFLSFGGLCIHFQIMGHLAKMRVKYINFLISRIISGVISYGVMSIWCIMNPHASEVFCNIAEKTGVASNTNAGLSIVLLIGCVVIIFDIESKKLKLI